MQRFFFFCFGLFIINKWEIVLCRSGDHAVTEEHLDLLRDNIGAGWKRCARRLGLTSVEIETIEYDFHRDGLSEMVHQMLDRWKMKEGSIGCTIRKLFEALEGNVKVDLLQKILDTCKSSTFISWTQISDVMTTFSGLCCKIFSGFFFFLNKT